MNASAQNQMELLLEQSPYRGGSMTPGSGIHTFSTGARVTLTAVPEAGYRFSHWLGDVSDPHSSTTHIQLDNSKVVVAVYDPIGGKDGFDEESSILGGGGGSSQLLPTAANFFQSSFSAPGGSRAWTDPGVAVIPTSPVPEPATVMLLGLGALTLSAKRRRLAG